MPEERATYVTYNEGLEAKHLHLGNLVHDYKNPNSLDPHIETAYTDIEEPPPAWARSTALGNYALTLGKISEESDSEDEDSGSEDDSEASQRYLVAAAAKTTKIEIKDPKKFFEKITLTTDEAKKWLSSHLSAAEALALKQGKAYPRPEIWMLTGLILMTHSTWTNLSSNDPSFIPGLQAPFDPTGVSAIRRLSVSDGVKPTFGLTETNEGKHVSGAVIHETGKYPGTRGWAAKWQRVDVKIVPSGKSQEDADNQLRLGKISDSSPKIAVVELQDAYAKNKSQENSVGDFDEKYWETFLDVSEEYA